MTVIHEGTTNLDTSLRENRVFEPSPEFRSRAHISSLEQYEQMYRRSVEQPEEFWAEAASELEWFAPWTRVLTPGPDGSANGAKWFVNGKLNLSHNCVDRHAKGARRDKIALLWEGEPGEVRKLTYADLSLFQMLEGLRYAFPNAMKRQEKKMPRALALLERVARRPRIAAYFASKRRIPFNEQGIFRYYKELDG